MIRRAIAIAPAVASISVAQASPFGRQPLPVPRIGNCPHGWLASGGSCVPSGSKQDAIPRTGGSCPWGWLASGAYCLRSSGR